MARNACWPASPSPAAKIWKIGSSSCATCLTQVGFRIAVAASTNHTMPDRRIGADVQIPGMSLLDKLLALLDKFEVPDLDTLFRRFGAMSNHQVSFAARGRRLYEAICVPGNRALDGVDEHFVFPDIHDIVARHGD